MTPAAVENHSDSLMRNVENQGDSLMRNVENQGDSLMRNVENQGHGLMWNVENHGDGLMRNVENQGREKGYASRRLLGRADPERGAAVLEMGECMARPRLTGGPWMLPTVVRANQGERRVCASHGGIFVSAPREHPATRDGFAGVQSAGREQFIDPASTLPDRTRR